MANAAGASASVRSNAQFSPVASDDEVTLSGVPDGGWVRMRDGGSRVL